MGKAYTCDVCGKFFDGRDGRHILNIYHQEDGWDTGSEIFKGDICPDCLGYVSLILIDAGCGRESLKTLAADYIRNHEQIKGMYQDEEAHV